jgi:penicillin amidase
MRVLKRIMLLIVSTLIVMIAVGAPGGYWFITKSHPQLNGMLHVAGLQSGVEILRDPMGVPHIYAENQDDLFFAQGYVQAQDRLWQMEYSRRAGEGTLSEILGPATIKQDRVARMFGLNRAARADWEEMSESEKRTLQAFANGVNAFITTHRDNLPMEFTLLGFSPQPWQPIDTIAFAAWFAYGHSSNFANELLRTVLVERLGEQAARQLVPDYPATGPFTIPPAAKAYSGGTPSDRPALDISLVSSDLTALVDLRASLGLGDEGIGSNSWVVDGTKSVTGKPILANDGHVGIQQPSPWYAIGLHCAPRTDACPYDVAGLAFPSAPGVVVGHNDHIAWGFTNSLADAQDLYSEEINPDNPNQVKFNGQWEDMQIVDEPIRVKGGATETLPVPITRHGPILTPVWEGAITQPLALQWTVLRERTTDLEAMLALDRARNWDEFREALRGWDMPSSNFLYADMDGNIGSQLAGRLPIRAQGNGMAPVPGTGEYEWTGYIPFDELPFVLNPSTHYLAAANNAIVPPDFKYWITADWLDPYRAQRIDDLLRAKEKFSLDDTQAMQADVYSIPLAELQNHVIAVAPEGPLQTAAMEAVKAWDGRLTTDAVGGTILEFTYQRLYDNIFSLRMDNWLLNYYRGMTGYEWRVVLQLLDDPASEWWGELGRDALLKKSFGEAVDALMNQLGNTPGEWRWGRLHTATFAHPLGSVQPLNLLFNVGPISVPGGNFTVSSAGYRIGRSFGTTTISSMRMIVDLSDLGRSLQIYPPGQSGQPLNKQYADMLLPWRDGQYEPMYFDRAALDRVREGILVLLP